MGYYTNPRVPLIRHIANVNHRQTHAWVYSVGINTVGINTTFSLQADLRAAA